jgi:hypothetical protein
MLWGLHSLTEIRTALFKGTKKEMKYFHEFLVPFNFNNLNNGYFIINEIKKNTTENNFRIKN